MTIVSYATQCMRMNLFFVVLMCTLSNILKIVCDTRITYTHFMHFHFIMVTHKTYKIIDIKFII